MEEKRNIYEAICTRFVIEPRACYSHCSWRPTVRWVIIKDLATGKILKDPDNKRRHLIFKNSSEAFSFLMSYIK